MHVHVHVPLSVTVTALLDGPVKPQIMLLILNVQFLSVAESWRFEQVADVPEPVEQLPQSEVMLYCTVGQLGSICVHANVSSSGRTLVRFTPLGAR